MWYIESVILNYIWRHDDIMQLQFVFFGRESSPFFTWLGLSFYIEELWPITDKLTFNIIPYTRINTQSRISGYLEQAPSLKAIKKP